jgi:iron complex transport system ATP-binding protein
VSELRAEAISFRYGAPPVLHDVSASVATGEVVGLIGPNGAGKTSLLRLMASLLTPASGEVRWGGRLLASIPALERARLLAYLAQGSPAHWPLAVERVVELGRIPHRAWWQGLSIDDRAAIDQAISRADIQHLKGRLVTTLSGGERARVMLARVFATQPSVILADEPVASLDPFHQLQVMGALREHAMGGGAVVVVLHDLNLAARFCDRLVLLDSGRIAAQGPVWEVLRDPVLAAAFSVSVEVLEQRGLAWVHLS